MVFIKLGRIPKPRVAHVIVVPQLMDLHTHLGRVPPHEHRFVRVHVCIRRCASEIHAIWQHIHEMVPLIEISSNLGLYSIIDPAFDSGTIRATDDPPGEYHFHDSVSNASTSGWNDGQFSSTTGIKLSFLHAVRRKGKPKVSYEASSFTFGSGTQNSLPD
jgi:hypothetical protein